MPPAQSPSLDLPLHDFNDLETDFTKIWSISRDFKIIINVKRFYGISRGYIKNISKDLKIFHEISKCFDGFLRKILKEFKIYIGISKDFKLSKFFLDIFEDFKKFQKFSWDFHLQDFKRFWMDFKIFKGTSKDFWIIKSIPQDVKF